MKTIPKVKIGFTYFLPHQSAALEYLSKHCENLRKTKVDILDEALTRLFKRVKPYKDLLETEEFKVFEKEYKKGLINGK